ncbi:hypothetical protein MKX08_009408 [Trichoderma sp. CBMAI-0020]|nr:hypothetical protein MKX08_009408 [Trichoderma sp. CBMAI-0020]
MALMSTGLPDMNRYTDHSYNLSRDQVAIASALNSTLHGANLCYVTAHPRLHMGESLLALSYYGYGVSEVDYVEWKTQLEEFVSASSVEKNKE